MRDQTFFDSFSSRVLGTSNKKTPVIWIAFLWGLLVFLPVGVNYLCFFLLLCAVVVQRDVDQRWRRLQHSVLFYAAIFFLLWTLVTLLAQPKWYDRTDSNLWHGVRILVTIVLAASLSTDEARAALRGFMCAIALVGILLFTYHSGWVAVHPFWEHLTMPGTNKTIGATILLTIFAGVLFSLIISSRHVMVWLYLGVLIIVMTVIVVDMPKRTALVGMLLGFSIAAVHLWRDHKTRWLLALAFVACLAGLLWMYSLSLQASFLQGIREVRDGVEGNVKVDSWNVRVQMIRQTLDMILDRPIFGWGIGSWNDQWKLRVPPELAGFNMPHNDALWMGAQGGILGAISWLVLMLSGLGLVWRVRDWTGAAATAAILVATFSSLVNNGTRDATIGLPMLWIMGILISYARKLP